MPKTIQQASENLRQVAQGAALGQRYTQGVEGADWASAVQTQQAQANWGEGTQRALAEGRFLMGVQRVSNQQWRQAAVNKGASRIGPGIVAGIQKYTERFGPILQAMNNASANLPPRSTSASQNIQQRLIPVVQAAVQAAGKQFT